MVGLLHLPLTYITFKMIVGQAQRLAQFRSAHAYNTVEARVTTVFL